MKKRIFFIFTAYVFLKTLLRFALHPFSGIREVIRHPVLLPVIFSPLLGLLTLFILGRIGSVLITIYGLKRTVVAVGLSTALISITLWQLLLLYFLLSFFIAFRRRPTS